VPVVHRGGRTGLLSRPRSRSTGPTDETGVHRDIAVPVLLLVYGATVATSSVVRYRLWIVVVYAALAAALAWYVARPGRPDGAGSLLDRPTAVLALGAVAVSHLTVRCYTYLQPGDARAVRLTLAVTAIVAAGVLLAPLLRPLPRLERRGPDVALGLAVAAFVAVSVALVHLDPRPRIDVWVTLQQAADAIGRGDNMYAVEWTNSPGVQDAFTYLPFTALLLAPGRWLAGDVRWALVAVTLVAVLAVRALPGRGAPPQQRLAAAAVGALVLLLPGTPTQVEQGWTEPLLLACLAGWAFGVHRGRPAVAVVCLALGVASKQHLVLLLPLLAAWPGFGPRRTAAAAGLAGVFVLPWFLASPADMWHDTVTVLVNFQPLLFADTLYIAAITEWGWTPPFWLTGAAILVVLVAAAVGVRRPGVDLPAVLRWAALVLFVASLVNKQAFYNQYWLVAAVVLVSWAVPPRATVDLTAEPERRPAAAAA
jgi:hypothetical protein